MCHSVLIYRAAERAPTASGRCNRSSGNTPNGFHRSPNISHDSCWHSDDLFDEHAHRDPTEYGRDLTNADIAATDRDNGWYVVIKV